MPQNPPVAGPDLLLPPAATRDARIDRLKALAIAAVIVTHSGPDFFDRRFGETDRLLRVVLCAFHVPVFLMVSGWLGHSRAPLSLRSVGRRLLRVWPAYVVATLLLTALGFASRKQLAFHLLSGGALGIYYYIPVWSFCMASAWLWSRLGDRALRVALALVIAVSLARTLVWPELPFFWAIRDPLGQGTLAYFLLGWCARRFGWDRLGSGRPSALPVALLLCLPWLLLRPSAGAGVDFALRLASRFAFSTSVAWLLLRLPSAPASSLALRLSMLTLPLFLYHQPLATSIGESLSAWPAAPRILATALVTLLLTLPAIEAVRRLLPPRLRLPLLGIDERPLRRT